MSTTNDRKTNLVQTSVRAPGSETDSTLPTESRTLAELQRQMDETLASSDVLPLMGALQDYVETERRQNTRRMTVLSVTFILVLMIFLIVPYMLGQQFLARTEVQLATERQSLQQFGNSVESGLKALTDATAELRQSLEAQKEALQAIREDILSSKIKLDLPVSPDVSGGVVAGTPSWTATGRVATLSEPVLLPATNAVNEPVEAPLAGASREVPAVHGSTADAGTTPAGVSTKTEVVPAPVDVNAKPEIAPVPASVSTNQARDRLLQIVGEIDAALAAIQRETAAIAPGFSNNWSTVGSTNR